MPAKPAAKRAAKSPARSLTPKSPAAKSAPAAKVPSPFLPVVRDFLNLAAGALVAFVLYTFYTLTRATVTATPPPAKDWTSWALGLVALT